MVTQAGDSGQVGIDLDSVEYWLEHLHGDSNGLIHVCATENWSGQVCESVKEAVAYVKTMDLVSKSGIYVRATTIKGKLPSGSRGSEKDSACLPALWADVDIAGPGHAHNTRNGLPLPPDEETARGIIQACNLPEPTLWVHSGGGLYPWWMLKDTYCIQDEDDLLRARYLSRTWHEVIAHAAETLNLFYGTEVADLARVLRVVGTVNRKVADNPRQCRLSSGGSGELYTFRELMEAANEAKLLIPVPEAARLSVPVPRAESADDELRPGDDFNVRGDWQEILVPQGWQVHHSRGDTVYWTRPGKELRDGYSATTGRAADADRLYVFSSSTPFTPELAYSKFAAYSLLVHGGDYSAAARELRGLNYGAPSQKQIQAQPEQFSPEQVVEGKVLDRGEEVLGELEDANPKKYMTSEGFQSLGLARDIIKLGPLAIGQDQILWRYESGVWVPSKHEIRGRMVRLLGNKYRSNLHSTVDGTVQTLIPTVTCDPIPEIINFRNGLYEWQSDLLKDHDPKILSTVQMGTDWDPDATCPEFDDFLSQVVDTDAVPLVWELIGYLMYSGNPLHKAIMLLGRGRNGKGTFLRVIQSLLGPGNTTSVGLHDLANNRFSAANLFGKIANVVGDIDGTYIESTAMFKKITGQDQITAEHKNRDSFNFTPWAVPVFSANKVPGSADTTTGYLSKWVVIEFPNTFTGREDRSLNERLQTKPELQGIAAKAMPALRTLMARGNFELTESTRQAQEHFERGVDQIKTWVHECAELAPDLPFVPRAEMYKQYTNWAGDNGYGKLKSHEVYERLEQAGATPGRAPGMGTRGFTGIRIVNPGTWLIGGQTGYGSGTD